MTMAISPAEASKRAQNFGIAETAAVVFSATYEGKTETSSYSLLRLVHQKHERIQRTLTVLPVLMALGSMSKVLLVPFV